MSSNAAGHGTATLAILRTAAVLSHVSAFAQDPPRAPRELAPSPLQTLPTPSPLEKSQPSGCLVCVTSAQRGHSVWWLVCDRSAACQTKASHEQRPGALHGGCHTHSRCSVHGLAEEKAPGQEERAWTFKEPWRIRAEGARDRGGETRSRGLQREAGHYRSLLSRASEGSTMGGTHGIFRNWEKIGSAMTTPQTRLQVSLPAPSTAMSPVTVARGLLQRRCRGAVWPGDVHGVGILHTKNGISPLAVRREGQAYRDNLWIFSFSPNPAKFSVVVIHAVCPFKYFEREVHFFRVHRFNTTFK